MKEIHFFENEDDEFDWNLHQEMDGRTCHFANDFAKMKYIAGHLPEFDGVICTIQMGYLDTRWFEEGYRIFVHDHTGVFEIVLGDGNERTSRHIRYAHCLYRMWLNGEFEMKEERE